MYFILRLTVTSPVLERGWGSHLRVGDMWQNLFVNFLRVENLWRCQELPNLSPRHTSNAQTHTHTCLKARWSVTSLYVNPRNWIKQMRDSEHTALVRQHVCLPGHFWVHSYLYVCVCVLASLTSLGALVRRFSRLFVCGYVFVPKGRSMGNSSRPNLIVAVQTDL